MVKLVEKVVMGELAELIGMVELVEMEELI